MRQVTISATFGGPRGITVKFRITREKCSENVSIELSVKCCCQYHQLF